MRHFTDLNYVAVLITSVVYFFIGMLWYSRKVFGKTWAIQSGLNMETDKIPTSKMILIMAGQFISSVVFTIGVGVIVDMIRHHHLKQGVYAAVFVALFFIFPLNSSTLFFKNKPKLFFIDAAYYAIGALLAGIVLSIWK